MCPSLPFRPKAPEWHGIMLHVCGYLRLHTIAWVEKDVCPMSFFEFLLRNTNVCCMLNMFLSGGHKGGRGTSGSTGTYCC